MTQIFGTKGKIWIDDQVGTCRDMSGDTNNITFTRSVTNPETTTLGKNTVQRIQGLRDATIDVTAVYSTGSATDVAGLLDDMHSGSLVSRVQYLPAGSVSGCPIYTGSFRLTNHTVTQPVDGVVTATFSLQTATASILSTCVA